MAKVHVHELRRLVLPVEAAVDAIVELDREHGGRLWRSAILEVQVDTSQDPGLVIVFQPAGSAERERRQFSLAAIAAAIINFCWKARIPLPRQGVKRMDIVPEGFAMTIESTVELLRRHGPLPAGGITSVATHAPAAEPPAPAETDAVVAESAPS